jgi:hypothetical protein
MGGFIVAYSVLVMAAMFYAADLPLWKLGVTIVAAVIVARYGWRFLWRYRSGSLLTFMQGDFRERNSGRRMLGAGK